jgi:adenylate kinase
MMMNQEPIIHPYEGKFSTILLFGPPAAGKGTLGKFLSSAGSQYHLSSGDIFRSLPAYSPAGKLYYSYASKGLLIPDEATIEIWKHYVHGLIATNAYYPESQDLLLDGIPRTPRQAEILSSHISVRQIIVLEVSDHQILLDRMLARARQEGRMDDVNADVIRKRLDIYHQQIEDVLNLYPKHLHSSVNGNQKPLDVLRDVLVRLSHLLSHGPTRRDSNRIHN